MSEQQKIVKPPVNVLDISEAKIVSSKIEDDEKTNEDNNYVKNLKDQKIIDLAETGKKQSSEKITIDFMNEEHVTGFTSSETKKSEDFVEEDKFSSKTSEDLKNDLKKEENNSSNLKPKDLEDVANFIIFLIDASFSSFFKFYAKDTSDAAYSLPEKKKEMLSYQLTLILVKYQAKFKIEFMFLVTILVIYIPAFMKASSNRKKNKFKEKDFLKTNDFEELIKDKKDNIDEVIKANQNKFNELNNNSENNKENLEVLNKTKVYKIPLIKKRGKGNPGKL